MFECFWENSKHRFGNVAPCCIALRRAAHVWAGFMLNLVMKHASNVRQRICFSHISTYRIIMYACMFIPPWRSNSLIYTYSYSIRTIEQAMTDDHHNDGVWRHDSKWYAIVFSICMDGMTGILSYFNMTTHMTMTWNDAGKSSPGSMSVDKEIQLHRG